MQQARWKIKEYDEAAVKKLSKELHVDRIIAVLLNNKGIFSKDSGKEFLSPDLINNLHNPFLFQDMPKAVERIRQAIDQKEKIIIYGDRDVDGVSSSALVFKALK
ncbi:MAG: single-stranded-DNA-specific exonuclease RecJ, partial [Spirochaetes bacterium]|nr:single-stranded-DNA-specific exonuclease RecJ [Spirochaetota bacterium]